MELSKVYLIKATCQMFRMRYKDFLTQAINSETFDEAHSLINKAQNCLVLMEELGDCTKDGTKPEGLYSEIFNMMDKISKAFDLDIDQDIEIQERESGALSFYLPIGANPGVDYFLVLSLDNQLYVQEFYRKESYSLV